MGTEGVHLIDRIMPVVADGKIICLRCRYFLVAMQLSDQDKLEFIAVFNRIFSIC